MPAEYHARALGAWPIKGHLHWLQGMVRQRAVVSETEPSAESRSPSRRTRPAAWSDKPASGVPGPVRPTQVEGGERRCCPRPR